jgi:hypothetical protein
MFAMTSCKFRAIACIFALVTVPLMIRAESLDDFKRAKAETTEECKTIPYSSERDRCLSKRDDVFAYCKTEDSGCTGLKTYARMQDLEKAKRDLADADRSRDELRRQRDSASDDSQKRDISEKISSLERTMDEGKRNIEQLTKTIEDQRSMATGREEKAKRCIASRNDASQIFADAERKASSESDPEIKPLAAELIARWKEGNARHASGLTEIQSRLGTCEKAARGEQF